MVVSFIAVFCGNSISNTYRELEKTGTKNLYCFLDVKRGICKRQRHKIWVCRGLHSQEFGFYRRCSFFSTSDTSRVPGSFFFPPGGSGAIRPRIRTFAQQGCWWWEAEFTLNLCVKVGKHHVNETAPQALLIFVRGTSCSFPGLGFQGPQAALGLGLSCSSGSSQVPPGLERLQASLQFPYRTKPPCRPACLNSRGHMSMKALGSHSQLSPYHL